MSPSPSALLADHPDRIRWNAKYECADPTEAVFAPISWLGDVLQFGVPEGPVLELACGRSGTALGLAAAGRCVTAIDVSDTALVQLELEATRRELADRLTLVHADLCSWQSGDGRFALVLCRLSWHPPTFRQACEAVAPGGVVAWEAWRRPIDVARDTRRAEWCLKPGQPESELPAGFTVIRVVDTDGSEPSRRIIAQRSL